MSLSDKIDSIVTNRLLGIPIFVLVMWAVYYVSVTTVGTFVTDWTNDTFVGAIQGWAGDALAAAGASDLIVSLVVDGIIGGVGAVLGFVPQMAILFLFLSILEDCGYMVRIAFVMDRVFRHYDGSDHVLCRYCCGSCIRDHVKEDQTVLRQTSSVRYGASGVPHSVR